MPPDGLPFNGAEPPRPQADPLPSKRGETGYTETVEPPTDILHFLNTHDLPTSHSVDRNSSPMSPNSSIIPPAHSEVVTCPSSDQSSSTFITKSNGMFGGLRLYSLVIFAVQLAFLGGTVTAWVFSSKCLSKRLSLTAEKSQRTPFGLPPTIVHIIFVVIVLIQIVFLERILFRLREERYKYVHHGEILPHHRISRSSVTSIFAPWNHPPLPTYAAALSQSGVATGDVEDCVIAGSPPPAYSNTGGSTLVLSGISRNSLIRESGTDRPLSYVSRDEQRNRVQNVESVRRLEESMDRLEPPSAAYIAR